MQTQPFADTHVILNKELFDKPLAQQQATLEQLTLRSDIIQLDLGNNFLPPELASIICKIISNNRALKNLILHNNNFSNAIGNILNTIITYSIDLDAIDIVDNLIIDQLSYGVIAELITHSNIKDIAVGARRIMGSSGGEYAYFDEDYRQYLCATGQKPYHNTWWPNGYRGTGFNELTAWSEDPIIEAVKIRNNSNNPIQRLHLASRSRSQTVISKSYKSSLSAHSATDIVAFPRGASFQAYLSQKYGANYEEQYSYDRRKNSDRFPYSWDYYIKDDWVAPKMRGFVR